MLQHSRPTSRNLNRLTTVHRQNNTDDKLSPWVGNLIGQHSLPMNLSTQLIDELVRSEQGSTLHPGKGLKMSGAQRAVPFCSPSC